MIDSGFFKLNAKMYRDTGCPDGEYPSCLNCPLPRCREDKEEIRDRTKIAEEMLRNSDLSLSQIAEASGYTKAGIQGIARRLGLREYGE